MEEMMRKLIFLAVLMALAVAAHAASDMPGADADALWKHLTETDYRSWGSWPDHQGMQPGKAPHGPFHIVYVNNVGLVKGHPKPVGSMVVKENFSPDKKLTAITVMYKAPGYNPVAGDWFWVKYTPEGAVEKAGMPKGCIACRSARADMDYIMVSDY